MKKSILKISILILVFTLLNITYLFSQYGKWTIIDTTIHMVDSSGQWSYSFAAIKCADSLNCCAIGNMSYNYPWNRVTTDGGIHWSTTLIDTAIIDPKLGFIYDPPKAYDIAYPDTNLCVIVGDSGYIWRSTNKCRTWEKTKIGTDKYLFDIDFYNKNIGGIITFNAMFLTKDGGVNWTKKLLQLPDTTNTYYYIALKFLDSSSLIVSAYNVPNPDYNAYQYSFISKDFGNSWNFYPVDSLSIIHFYFINKKIGWAVGYSVFSSFGPLYYDVILKTTDGGITWKKQLDTLLPSQSGLNQIYFSDSLNGIAIGPWFKMWRTSDGGDHWKRDTSYNYKSVKIFFNDLVFFSPTKIIGVSDGNWIYKLDRTDGINYWQSSDDQNMDISIFPNPTTDKITVRFNIENPSQASFTIYDSRGDIVEKTYSSYFNAGTNDISYMINKKYPDGIYFLRVDFGKTQTITKPFIILN